MKHGSEIYGRSILVTGGTGSFGRAFVREVLSSCPDIKRLVVFSRDELKQHEMSLEFPVSKYPGIRYFIGDVRDQSRLRRALEGIDTVVHAAALKQVPTAEYNPFEFIQTNVLGAQNLIEACLDTQVKRVVALSTDKASSPINLYGATKLTADKLFVAANNYSIAYGTAFSVVRYGNVMGSRGSVIPFFRELAHAGKPLPLTDVRMTRFWISIQNAVQFVMDSFDLMSGGELYVPRIPSMKLVDLAEAIAPGTKVTEIGMRPGEKLHEEMISNDDSRRTLLLGSRYLVMPVVAEWGYKPPQGIPMQEGQAYRSDTNDLWLSMEDIRAFVIANPN